MAADEVCASCGVAAVDDVKLKKCDDGCDLVKYCSINCQKNHREQHNEGCKMRRAEIRNKTLFTQPDSSHYGECPICCLPLSLDIKKSTLMECCSKRICRGCDYANQKREAKAGLERRCVFCREPLAETGEEINKRCMKRIKKNDPVAMRTVGIKHLNRGDHKAAFKYWTNAAELGDAEAHYELSVMYGEGQGIEKDTEKEMYHLEQAAIGGHASARCNLGIEEADNGRIERAKKHWIIAANLGDDGSLKCLMKLYRGGDASKEEYSDALRAYQAAVDATKSSDREKAEEALKRGDIRTI